ncbi:MAG: putative maltokinase, partial [Rhodanobacteraceae bacterium]
DAGAVETFTRACIAAIAQNRQWQTDAGRVVFAATGHVGGAIDADTEIRRLGVEQSNTSIRIGDVMILKLYRKLSAGAHPEVETGRFLTAVGFANAPPLIGTLERIDNDGASTALAVLQGFVRNQGDGWTQTVEHLARRLEEIALPAQEDAAERKVRDFHVDLLATLGRRTAELHRAFATPSGNAAFVPEPITRADTDAWLRGAKAQADAAFAALKHIGKDADADLVAAIATLAGRKRECLGLLTHLADVAIEASKTRIHGDYHLGQVLLAKDDWMIVDFEGEPARPLAQRSAKQSPLRDVAGMLRSFDYVTAAALARFAATANETPGAVREFARAWRDAAADAFLGAYREAMADVASWPTDVRAAQRWLDLFMLEKACYEIIYEANNRPDWLAIPVRGVMEILDGHG